MDIGSISLVDDISEVITVQDDGDSVVIYNNIGARGETGQPGEIGPKGDKGDIGPAGTTDYNQLTNKPNLSGTNTGDQTLSIDGQNLTISGSAGNTVVLPIVSGVSSVNTRTGDITLSKTDVGLGNVENTSDADKPVSSAVQSALNAKANATDTVNLTGNQTVAGVKTFSSSPIVPTATTNTQAVNKSQMDTADALKVNKAGDTMTGNLNVTPAIDGADVLRINNSYGSSLYTFNSSLSQATSVTILPKGDSVRDLGDGSTYWRNTYTDRLYLNSTAYLDGATAGRIDVAGLVNIAANSIYAFLVGQDTANPTFKVNTSGTNAVTGINIAAATAGSGVTLSVLSPGANEDLHIRAKGTGAIKLQSSTNNFSVANFYGVPNAVNYVLHQNAVTTGAPSITAAGLDTNVSLKLAAKGTGTVQTANDLEVTDDTKGIILKSPDGTRYRLTVANGGTLTVSAA